MNCSPSSPKLTSIALNAAQVANSKNTLLSDKNKYSSPSTSTRSSISNRSQRKNSQSHQHLSKNSRDLFNTNNNNNNNHNIINRLEEENIPSDKLSIVSDYSSLSSSSLSSPEYSTPLAQKRNSDSENSLATTLTLNSESTNRRKEEPASTTLYDNNSYTNLKGHHTSKDKSSAGVFIMDNHATLEDRTEKHEKTSPSQHLSGPFTTVNSQVGSRMSSAPNGNNNNRGGFFSNSGFTNTGSQKSKLILPTTLWILLLVLGFCFITLLSSLNHTLTSLDSLIHVERQIIQEDRDGSKFQTIASWLSLPNSLSLENVPGETRRQSNTNDGDNKPESASLVQPFNNNHHHHHGDGSSTSTSKLTIEIQDPNESTGFNREKNPDQKGQPTAYNEADEVDDRQDQAPTFVAYVDHINVDINTNTKDSDNSNKYNEDIKPDTAMKSLDSMVQDMLGVKKMVGDGDLYTRQKFAYDDARNSDRPFRTLLQQSSSMSPAFSNILSLMGGEPDDLRPPSFRLDEEKVASPLSQMLMFGAPMVPSPSRTNNKFPSFLGPERDQIFDIPSRSRPSFPDLNSFSHDKLIPLLSIQSFGHGDEDHSLPGKHQPAPYEAPIGPAFDGPSYSPLSSFLSMLTFPPSNSSIPSSQFKPAYPTYPPSLLESTLKDINKDNETPKMSIAIVDLTNGGNGKGELKGPTPESKDTLGSFVTEPTSPLTSLMMSIFDQQPTTPKTFEKQATKNPSPLESIFTTMQDRLFDSMASNLGDETGRVESGIEKKKNTTGKPNLISSANPMDTISNTESIMPEVVIFSDAPLMTEKMQSLDSTPGMPVTEPISSFPDLVQLIMNNEPIKEKLRSSQSNEKSGSVSIVDSEPTESVALGISPSDLIVEPESFSFEEPNLNDGNKETDQSIQEFNPSRLDSFLKELSQPSLVSEIASTLSSLDTGALMEQDRLPVNAEKVSSTPGVNESKTKPQVLEQNNSNQQPINIGSNNPPQTPAVSSQSSGSSPNSSGSSQGSLNSASPNSSSINATPLKETMTCECQRTSNSTSSGARPSGAPAGASSSSVSSAQGALRPNPISSVSGQNASSSSVSYAQGAQRLNSTSLSNQNSSSSNASPANSSASSSSRGSSPSGISVPTSSSREFGFDGSAPRRSESTQELLVPIGFIVKRGEPIQNPPLLAALVSDEPVPQLTNQTRRWSHIVSTQPRATPMWFGLRHGLLNDSVNFTDDHSPSLLPGRPWILFPPASLPTQASAKPPQPLTTPAPKPVVATPPNPVAPPATAPLAPYNTTSPANSTASPPGESSPAPSTSNLSSA